MKQHFLTTTRPLSYALQVVCYIVSTIDLHQDPRQTSDMRICVKCLVQHTSKCNNTGFCDYKPIGAWAVLAWLLWVAIELEDLSRDYDSSSDLLWRLTRAKLFVIVRLRLFHQTWPCGSENVCFVLVLRSVENITFSLFPSRTFPAELPTGSPVHRIHPGM